MHSLAEENYLKGLFHLANEAGETGVNELSRHLGIKMPTVNSMVKRLAEKGLVHYESYKPLRLTDKGRHEAALIIRKHRLTEMFLVEKMGFGWESVHEIAEQIEHIQAPEFFDRMDALLGHPTADPHGAPIPDKEGKLPAVQHIRLSDCRRGDTVKLVMVEHATAEFLKFLNSRQLALGTVMRLQEMEPYDGSITISYHDHDAAVLSKNVCDALLVEKL